MQILPVLVHEATKCVQPYKNENIVSSIEELSEIKEISRFAKDPILSARIHPQLSDLHETKEQTKVEKIIIH